MFQSLAVAALMTLNSSELKLKSGDIILESIPCHICTIIEREERAPYSHAGVIHVDPTGHITVMEAWTDPIGRVPLSQFLSRKKPESKALVMRPKEVISSEALLRSFDEHFLGLHYDSEFLWNNTDLQGERLYCSELVAKLLNPFLTTRLKTKPMHYNVDAEARKAWIAFFRGTPPDGKPGISPGDLSRAPGLIRLGEIE